ncbi:metal-sensitive transcriptional regulator [Candidatus Nomurabacteria bacterium]|nr:metal-sensitive transcriptional regulator [Candidatus Nomurabacteria bacterium]
MKKEVKKRVTHRLKIIEGQVRGLNKMIDEEAYCLDIITQSSAIRHALGSIEDLMLENHLTTHVKEQMQSGEDKKAAEEILAIYKLAKKK